MECVQAHSGKMEEDLSLNLQEKQAVVAEVSAQVALAQTIVLAEYRGITVSDITRLRANARKSGVYFHVLKNTLVHVLCKVLSSNPWLKKWLARWCTASVRTPSLPPRWCM